MAITERYHDDRTIEAHTRSGVWPGKTLDDYLREHAQRTPDKPVLAGRRHTLTFGELERLAHRAACGLFSLGLRPGDVASIQLPNWAEWLIMHCAVTKLGAVTNSIGAMYRHKEVEYILRYAGTKVLVVPDTYRRFSHTDMVEEIRDGLPDLEHVFVVGDEVPSSMRGFGDLLDESWEDGVDRATIEALRPDPNSVATLMFTSGTTADPKGVMHTHNTMVCGTAQLVDAYGLSGQDVVFMASPIGHSNVACVAMPDPVLSERVCAHVMCEPGEHLEFDEMVEFLKGKRVSAWKLPERLELREEFPMTPSGKIQKFLLREDIAALVGEQQLVR